MFGFMTDSFSDLIVSTFEVIKFTIMKNIRTITFLLLSFAASFSFAQQVKSTKISFLPLPTSQSHISFAVNGDEILYATKNPDKAGTGSIYSFNKSWTQMTQKNSGLPHAEINYIKVLSGVFHLCSDSGLLIKNPSTWVVINSKNSSLNTDKIYLVDKSGDMTALLTSKGISYKRNSDLSWTNVSFADLKAPSIRPYLSKSLVINGDEISFMSLGKTYIKYNTKTNKTIALTGLSSFLVNAKNTIYATSNYGQLKTVSDSIEELYVNNICGSDNFFSFTLPLLSPMIFVDKFDKVWKLSKNSEGIHASCIVDGKFSTSLIVLPLLADEIHLAYDAEKDRLFSLEDGLFMEMKDLREILKVYPRNFAVLDINKATVPINNLGDKHRIQPSGAVGSAIPNTGCISPVIASGLWIGGVDDDGELHLAAMTYRQSGVDYQTGPIDDISSKTQTPDSATYDRVWKINKSDVLLHQSIYQKNGKVGASETSEAIWNWPGNRTNTNEILAPFVDQDKDGIYEPQDGDYPEIPGDQCVFYIMNDKSEIHEESKAIPLGVEIQVFNFAYSCSDIHPISDAAALNYSTFHKYVISNRSLNDYKDVVVSEFTDVDLGNYSDDFVGSHVTLNTGYGYNGDNEDENGGYGLNPPQMNVVVLNAPKSIHDGIDGDGDGKIDEDDEKRFMGSFMTYSNDFSNYGNPRTAKHHYNLMNGLWLDSSSLQYHRGLPDSAISKYAFSGDTDPDLSGVDWTAKSENTTPRDVRFLTNSYPFDLFSEDKVEFEVAYVYSRDVNALSQLSQSIRNIKAIKEWYLGDKKGDCMKLAAISEESGAIMLALYPNPTNGEVRIESKEQIQSVRVYDMAGIELMRYSHQDFGIDSISLKHLTPGLYVIELASENGIAREKVLKLGY
jgi:hypothetical protein